MQACKRYPPVGASQSNISPATYTFGLLVNMRSLSIELKLTPPAVEILFLIVTAEREIQLPIIYYTRLYPKKYCKSLPDLDRIGLYSFALNPFDIEPSGTCNFSKINDKNIKIAFANNDTTNITGKDLYFFGVNYNVLIITNGMGAVRYT